MLGRRLTLVFMLKDRRFAHRLNSRSRAQHVQTKRTAAPALAVQTVAGIQRRQLLRHDLNGDLPTSALTDGTCGGDLQVLVRLKFEDMAGAGFAQVPPGSDRELRTLKGVQVYSALHYC